MDWFEQLTGFRELTYRETRAKLRVKDAQLYSLVNGKSYGIGALELASLQSLRGRAADGPKLAGRLRASVITGDIRQLHSNSEYAGALFQVASQFNLLEMTGPEVLPEDGVTRYQHDRTQGPACAIAAGAATIYRNYFVPVDGVEGQTRDRQLNALAGLGSTLSDTLRRPVDALWSMSNGYAMCSGGGLEAITNYLKALDEAERDRLRGALAIGIHRDVEVTDGAPEPRPVVSQAFCSALPVAYSSVPSGRWQQFASLVLEASYEATIWAALLNAQRGVSNVVLLTSVGGGAFGNADSWISAAIHRALRLAAGFDLDVKLVSYRRLPQWMRDAAEDFL